LESGSTPAVKVPVDTTIEDGLMDKANDTITLTPLSQVALQQIKHSILYLEIRSGVACKGSTLLPMG